jgi:hypothetical protein
MPSEPRAEWEVFITIILRYGDDRAQPSINIVNRNVSQTWVDGILTGFTPNIGTILLEYCCIIIFHIYEIKNQATIPTMLAMTGGVGIVEHARDDVANVRKSVASNPRPGAV